MCDPPAASRAETVEAGVSPAQPGVGTPTSVAMSEATEASPVSETDSAAAAVESGSDGDLFASESMASGVDEALSDLDTQSQWQLVGRNKRKREGSQAVAGRPLAVPEIPLRTEVPSFEPLVIVLDEPEPDPVPKVLRKYSSSSGTDD